MTTDSPGRSPERRLAAILSADVAEYTRLMEADEADTHARFMQLRWDVLDPGIAACGGRVVKNTGDGFVATFGSVTDAVQCALGLQESLARISTTETPDRQLRFRMGLHIGDIFVEKDDVYGEDVNIAARLQAYAEPGSIIISAPVAEQIRSRTTAPIVDLGDLHLKNIRRPVHAFSLRVGGVSSARWGPGSSSTAIRPSIAVLPFRKTRADPDQAYFADGVVEDIIRALASLQELFVVSRGSTLRYGGTAVDARKVGRELGVRYILHCSIRRAGQLLRIGTELSDAETGIVVLADRYDGELSELFELQDQISTRVVTTIAPHVRRHDLKRAMRKHPESMDAYDLVLQALDFLYRMDYQSFSRARGLLQQAMVLDSTYAPAYAYAAAWHFFRVGQGWSPDPDADAREAARLAGAAIDRDKYDALALAIYGHVHSFLLKDYATGAGFLDRALAASPNSAMAWALSSCTCTYVLDCDTAIARAEKALRLTPLDPHIFLYQNVLAMAHYWNGAYEQAIEWAQRAAAQNPSFSANLRTLVAALMAIGREKDAKERAKTLLIAEPKFGIAEYLIRCPFKESPQRTLFIERLRQAGLPD